MPFYLYDMKVIELVKARNLPSMKGSFGSVSRFEIPEPVYEYIKYLQTKAFPKEEK